MAGIFLGENGNCWSLFGIMMATGENKCTSDFYSVSFNYFGNCVKKDCLLTGIWQSFEKWEGIKFGKLLSYLEISASKKAREIWETQSECNMIKEANLRGFWGIINAFFDR